MSLNNKLKIGIAFVSGLNLTSHDTNCRQPCNTCNFINVKLNKIIQGEVRFYAGYRIKQHAPLRVFKMV